MPTPSKGPRLGGGPAHERLMLAGLATALFEHDRITTTEAKAKTLRPIVEKLVTIAREDSLHHRKLVMSKIDNEKATTKLFEVIAPRFEEQPGGYIRISKLGQRHGDAAPQALIEFIEA